MVQWAWTFVFWSIIVSTVEGGNSTSTTKYVSAADFDGIILLLFAIIVFFMQAGFAMLEAGSVSDDLTVNIIVKNLIDSSVVAVVFWAVGYGLSFGSPSTSFTGLGSFFLSDVPPSKLPYVFFQYSFCATAATIVSGAVAGRLRITSYVIYCIAMSSCIHPILAHWAWDTNGWLHAGNAAALAGVGAIDFAGGAVVHINGGAAALAACLVCGYRNQNSNTPLFPPRFERRQRKNASKRSTLQDVTPTSSRSSSLSSIWRTNGQWHWIQNALPSHSPNEVAYGCFILWFGFFAFNMGSIITFVGNSDLVALIAINTALSGALAAMFTIVIGIVARAVRSSGKVTWKLDDVVNGTLVGLVAATSGCALVQPWASVVTGVCAAIAYHISCVLLVRFRIDDPVQAIPVHMGGGVTAVLCASLFATPEQLLRVYGTNIAPGGSLMGGGGIYFATGLVLVLTSALWSFALTYALLGILYLIDRPWRFRWFFIRSSYDAESVEVGDTQEVAVSEDVKLGIADVTSSAFDQSNMLMFHSTSYRATPELLGDFEEGSKQDKTNRKKRKVSLADRLRMQISRDEDAKIEKEFTFNTIDL